MPADRPDADAVASEILRQTALRGSDKSICPSEVARALAVQWRPLMPLVRAAAADLQRAGLLEVTQRGRPVDPDRCRGPVRLRMPRS